MRLLSLIACLTAVSSCTSEPKPKTDSKSQSIFVVYQEPANVDYSVAFAKIEESGSEVPELTDCESPHAYKICHKIFEKGTGTKVAAVPIPKDLQGKPLTVKLMLLSEDTTHQGVDTRFNLMAQTRESDPNCPELAFHYTSSDNEKVELSLCAAGSPQAKAKENGLTYKICSDSAEEVCSKDQSGNSAPFEEDLQALCLEKSNTSVTDSNDKDYIGVCKTNTRWSKAAFCWWWGEADKNKIKGINEVSCK